MDMANVIGFWPAAAVFLFLIAHLGFSSVQDLGYLCPVCRGLYHPVIYMYIYIGIVVSV